MKDNKWIDSQIKHALLAEADGYTPPADLKRRIDMRIAGQKKEVVSMKKMSVKKVAVAAAVMCVLTGTVCMAGGKITGYIGGTRAATQTDDYADIEKLAEKLDLKVKAPQSFDNGYAFAYASIADFDAVDENHVTVKKEAELDVVYEKEESDVFYSVKKGATSFDDEELARVQTIEQDGMTYYYFADQYLFLPPDEEPTAEELAAEKAGTLNISYGSDERKEQEYDSLWWNADGQSYSLAGFDLDMDAQALLDMALQIR